LSDGAPIPEDGYREVLAYAFLRELGGHENVLHCHGVAQDEEWWFLVLEHCERDLFAEVLDGPLTDARARSITVDVMAALVYLNTHGILHRDLSLENVLLGPDRRPRVMDFGVAFDGISNPQRPLPPTEPVGKKKYMAPEIAMRRPWDERSDLWSLGVMLYMMLTRTELPWPRADHGGEVLRRIRAGEFAHLVHEAGRALPPMTADAIHTIGSLLTFDLDRRPSVVGVLQLPWLHDELTRRWRDAGEVGPHPVRQAQMCLHAGELARLRVLDALRAAHMDADRAHAPSAAHAVAAHSSSSSSSSSSAADAAAAASHHSRAEDVVLPVLPPSVAAAAAAASSSSSAAATSSSSSSSAAAAASSSSAAPPPFRLAIRPPHP
jgi:serine/threonine protein kinase